MPRLVKRPGSSLWWVRFRVDGKLHQASTGQRDRPLALETAAKIEAEARAAARERRPVETGNGPSLAILGTRDTKAAKARGVTDGTLAMLGTQWRNLIHSEALTGLHAAGITAAKVEEYIQERRDQGVRGQTIRMELMALRRALLVAEHEAGERGVDLRTLKLWPKIRKDPKHRTRTGREVPPAKLDRFIRALPAGEVRDQFRFALLTGIRTTEMWRLEHDWIVKTRRGAEPPAMVRLPDRSTKTGRTRIVGLPREALAIVTARKGRSPVFETINPCRLGSVEAARKAKVGFVPTLHDMRTTHASLATFALGDPKAVQVALGHSNLATTDLYLRSTLSRTVGVAETVAALFRPPAKAAAAKRARAK